MPITATGQIVSCPCCFLGIPFTFKEETLLTLQPGSATDKTAKTLVRAATKHRVCRQCGFILGLPENDQNNLWAKANAERIKAYGRTPVAPEDLRLTRRGNPLAPTEDDLQAGPTAVNAKAAPIAPVAPPRENDQTDTDAELLNLGEDDDLESGQIENKTPPQQTGAAKPRAAATAGK